uniref:Uncharacterized protein n=1 Tax=Picea glauca TaxID=3330 RepID=A0A101LXJ4_PICGL|nr:hypothetical protein ABT39_MTgene6193 [Picea glauca]QHR88713.1 hypothetical protein Q903MT_gene2727 [Picea sitchensis]
MQPKRKKCLIHFNLSRFCRDSISLGIDTSFFSSFKSRRQILSSYCIYNIKILVDKRMIVRRLIARGLVVGSNLIGLVNVLLVDWIILPCL